MTLALLLAAAAAGAAWCGSLGLDSLLVLGEHGDVWFEADCPRVFQNLTERDSAHSRSAVHPLAALFLYPPVTVLRAVGGLESVAAVRLVRAATAAACLAVFYVLLRVIGCRRVDSALFSLVAATSAAAVFWVTVPELYPAGLLTILLALGLVALAESRRLSPAWDVLANVATFSFTSTNWMAGVLAALVRWPGRKALGIILAAACFALALMALQHEFFPSAALWPISTEERRYMLPADAGGPAGIVPAFLFHSMVMPAIGTAARHGVAVAPIMTVQRSWPGSAGPLGLAAVGLWGLLLGLGAYGLWTCGRQRRLRAVLTLTVIGQLGLHLLYGLETFLYACHYGPLLVLVAALATLSPLRRVALALAVALVLCAGVNNAAQFVRAREFVEQRARASGAAPGRGPEAEPGRMAVSPPDHVFTEGT